MDARRDSRYIPLDSRASWAKGLLLLAGVVDLAAVLTGSALYRLADEAPSGTVTYEEFQHAEGLHALVWLVQLSVYVIAAVVFLRWFHRAYANLPALGVGRLAHRPPWAIGAWFVPLASLVWPKRIADDIWRGSDPSLTPERTEEWRRGKVPVIFGAWWRTFIVSGLLVAAGARLTNSAETFSELELGLLLEMIGNGLGVISGMLAYLVVDRTSERQGARAIKVATWRAGL